MNNSVLIYYFTGTGNSKRVSNFAAEKFVQEGYKVKLKSIDDGLVDEEHNIFSIHGFVFPVHSFGIPRIMEKFIESLPNNSQKAAFALTSYGSMNLIPGYEGSTLYRAKHLLEKKYKFLGADAVGMPDNFVILFSAPKLKNRQRLFNNAEIRTNNFINKIVSGKYYFRKRSYLIRLFLVPIFKAFRSGIEHDIGKIFRVDDKCNGCSVCAKICPFENIIMDKKTPKWDSKCEFCLRCINLCPKEAIQTPTGTKSRGRYSEPHFNISQLIK